MPLSVRFDDDEYLDSVTINNEEFYEKLILAGMICLQHPSRVRRVFEKVFKEYVDEGCDVVAIIVSTKLSGTLQSAFNAKMEVSEDKIHLIDSRIASFGTYLLISEACKLRDEGKSASEIVIK